jgi:hypothetical protein
MADIDYDRFNRLLTRCGEVAAEPGMKKSVVRVYADVLKDAADQFQQAHWAIQQAETASGSEVNDALSALTALDAPYREARSVVLAYVPAARLPDTLKTQPTDTDKLNAIEGLLKVLDEHAGKPWADEQKLGEFGQQSPKTLTEIKEAITASKALAAARAKRANAYGPAYDRYLRFKHVVRDGLGSKSPQYKRIHVRASRTAEEQQAPTPAPKESVLVKEESAPAEK